MTQAGGWGGGLSPPVFHRTVNTISTGGQIMPTTVLQAPLIFRPCHGPELTSQIKEKIHRNIQNRKINKQQEAVHIFVFE